MSLATTQSVDQPLVRNPSSERRRSSFMSRKSSGLNGGSCLNGGGGGHSGGSRDDSQLAMAAAAAEGVKLVQNSDQVGINCPEFGRSMTPPKIEQPKMRTSIFAHLILSFVGAAMFLAVGVWFLLISRDRQLNRLIGSAIAFLCAGLFITLGYVAVRRRRQKTISSEPQIEINPIALREQRRSMSNSLRKQTLPMTGDELMNQIRRHSTCITMESCDKALHGARDVRGHAAVIRTVSPKTEASAHLVTSASAIETHKLLLDVIKPGESGQQQHHKTSAA